MLGVDQRRNRRGVIDGGTEKKVRIAALVRNGLICRRCGGECLDGISESSFAEIECPICDGVGCSECNEGHFRLTSCGRRYIGNELVRALNLAALADKHLPSAGGLLDQSAWFIDLWTTFQNEQNRIDAERIERANSGR